MLAKWVDMCDWEAMVLQSDFVFCMFLRWVDGVVLYRQKMCLGYEFCVNNDCFLVDCDTMVLIS